jgi:nicotinamidase-related amidase
VGPEASDARIARKTAARASAALAASSFNVSGIVLTGISTSAGVDGTARAAQERSYNVTFASDAITDMDAATHAHVMTKVFPRLGEVGTTDAILALLR